MSTRAKTKGHSVWVSFCFGGAQPQFETVLQTVGEAESGSHIRLSDRCPLARHRERRDIFATGEYPAGRFFPSWSVFCFWCVDFGFELGSV